MSLRGNTYERALTFRSLSIASRGNGTYQGTAMDTASKGGADGANAWALSGSITDGTFAFTVEESADGSTGWVTIPTSRVNGTQATFTGADDNTLMEWGFSTSLRYVRLVLTVASATANATICGGFTLTDVRFEGVR